ncbi:glutamine synthetase [Actinomadura barringtoniae]|uniref:Glutamine synthetase n=1 Tax=Actinomadura barringtoniae TaxID=1427535 RepID=A0A939PDS4_9ACTN|nr:glutamine synthetase family protein [Actinomadura barringtoniae]MBO2450765.1 glutamine synthetase [Actinomadura barringtoniae]
MNEQDRAQRAEVAREAASDLIARKTTRAWAPAERYDQEGAPHPQDARGLARRSVDRLGGDGYTVRASFEIEWAVSIGEGDDFTPACAGPAYGMTRLTERADYLRDVVNALAATGIEVDQIHPEYAAGQYEISVAAADPVVAADNAVLVRETIRAVSRHHDLRASFSPKVTADGVGNGMHVHFSLWRDGRNQMAGGDGPYGLGPAGEAFAAGVLAHLPGLLAIGAPSVASYLRLVPSHWAGAFACWGLENREAALRFVTGAAGSHSGAANFEVKSFDGAANPYLTVAGLLAAGSAGLAEDAVLPKPVDVDPATLATDSGIAPLPATLEEAMAALEADKVLTEAFGEALIDSIGAVRRGEIAALGGCSPEEIAARLRWKY